MRSGPALLRLISLVALGALAIAAIPRARASTNLFKFYIGGSVKLTGLRAGTFHRSDSAWQLAAGIRALEVPGAEVNSLSDLDHPAAPAARPMTNAGS